MKFSTTKTLALIFLLTACSDDSDDTVSCDRPTKAGIQTIDVAQGDLNRPFSVYVPTTYTGKSAPLVFLLHPSLSSGDITLNSDNFQANAEKNGYIIAAPTGAVEFGAAFAWNIPGVPLVGAAVYPPDQAPDDIEYIDLAIDAVSEQFCVDSSRVYATGFSGGGRMSSQLGCDLSDRFAAVAPIGGARAPRASDTPPRTVQCAPTSAVPVLALHGTADVINEFADNDPGIVPGSSWTYGVPEAMERWALLNSCLTTDPLIESVSPQLDLLQYQGCDADTWLYQFEDVGHIIPPDAPELIWTFFSKQRQD